MSVSWNVELVAQGEPERVRWVSYHSGTGGISYVESFAGSVVVEVQVDLSRLSVLVAGAEDDDVLDATRPWILDAVLRVLSRGALSEGAVREARVSQREGDADDELGIPVVAPSTAQLDEVQSALVALGARW